MTSLLERFVEKYGRLPTEVDPDYLELLRMTKYSVRENPGAQPGKCTNCGSAKVDGRKYIDTRQYVEFYGNVCICSLCIHEFATELGLFEESDKQLKRMTDENEKKHELLEQGQRILKTLEEMKEYYVGLSSLGALSSGNGTPVVESYTPPEPGTSPEPDKKVGGAERRPIKSVAGPGRKNVPSLTDLLKD